MDGDSTKALKADQEDEAWKVAQLAATLLSGGYAGGKPIGGEIAVKQAIKLLQKARSAISEQDVEYVDEGTWQISPPVPAPP